MQCLMCTGNWKHLMNKRFMEEVADLNAKLSQISTKEDYHESEDLGYSEG